MNDILDDSYESDLTDEEHEGLILISEHAVAKPHPPFPMTDQHPITPPPHLLKKFSAQAQDETKKRNGAGYLKTFATLCIEWALNSQPTPNDRQIRSSEITPPPELVRQWMERTEYDEHTWFYESYIAEQAARWGANQELDACCKDIFEIIAGVYAGRVIEDWSELISLLRDGRRPTDAMQALDAFDRLQAGNGTDEDWRLVRQKLEKDCELPDQDGDLSPKHCQHISRL